MLNLGLMKHWENWFTVLLMVAIAAFAVNSLNTYLVKKDTK